MFNLMHGFGQASNLFLSKYLYISDSINFSSVSLRCLLHIALVLFVNQGGVHPMIELNSLSAVPMVQFLYLNHVVYSSCLVDNLYPCCTLYILHFDCSSSSRSSVCLSVAR